MDSKGKFNLHGVLCRLGGLNTQDCACLRFSSEFRFPLVEERRPAVDRLAELRDREPWIVGTGKSVRPKFGPFSRMVSEALAGSSLRTRIETWAHAESTRSKPRAENPSFSPVYDRRDRLV